MICLNVRDYGAKGDGIADDTTAIQACIDAAAEGDVVHFPRGRYRTTKTITINKTLALVGAAAYAQFAGFFGDPSYAQVAEWGSVIECYATNGPAFEHDPGRYTGLRLEHLAIKGVGDSARTTTGVRIAYVGGTVEVAMTGVQISNFKVGLDLDWIEYSHFDRLRINGCDVGVYGRVNTNANVFTALAASGCGDGVVLEGAGCNLFNGGAIQGSLRNGMTLRKNSDENTIKGVYFENAKADNAIRIDGSDAVSIETCHFGTAGDNVLIGGNGCRVMGGKYAQRLRITGYGTTVIGQGSATIQDAKSEGPPTVTLGQPGPAGPPGPMGPQGPAGPPGQVPTSLTVNDLIVHGSLDFQDGRRWTPDGLFLGAGREWTADGLYPGVGVKWAGFGAIGATEGEGLRFVGWSIDGKGNRRQGWIVPPLKGK